MAPPPKKQRRDSHDPSARGSATASAASARAKASTSSTTAANSSGKPRGRAIQSVIRTTTAASAAAALAAEKLAKAKQAPIAFRHLERYSVGLKVLLPETIYPNQSEVSTGFLLVNSISMLF